MSNNQETQPLLTSIDAEVSPSAVQKELQGSSFLAIKNFYFLKLLQLF
jgi:hypothetical protein